MSKSFKKTLGVILAIVFVAIIVFGAMQLWAPAKYKPLNWVAGSGEVEESSIDVVSGNMHVGDKEINGLALTACALSAEEYAENAVPAEAENAVKIAVAFAPKNTTDKELHVSLSFANAESEWANGKKVSDYVTVSVNKQEIVLTCLEAFGEKIVLRIDTNKPDVFASISVDYVRRPVSVSFDLKNYVRQGVYDSWAPSSASVSYVTFDGGRYIYRPDCSFGVGTLSPLVRVDKYEISFQEKLLIDTGLIGPCNVQSFVVSEHSVSADGYTDCVFTASSELLFELIKSSYMNEEQILEGLVKAVKGYPYINVKVSYSVCYGDTVFSTGERIIGQSVDFTPLFVPADEITPDKDGVIF